MNIAIPFIDRIWRAEGAVRIDEPLSPQEAFARLDPLFQTPGTTLGVAGDTLTYAKTNPAAQDKLATFTSGTLKVTRDERGTRLSFHVASTALLLCFLAPLLFLGFAQGMTRLNAWEQEKAALEASQNAQKDADKPKVKRELHPIDKFLGAPEPEDPAKKKDKKDEEPKEKVKTTPAYVLAGLFFLIYLVGRVLEPWLLKRTLRAALSGRPGESARSASEHAALGTSPGGAQPEAC